MADDALVKQAINLLQQFLGEVPIPPPPPAPPPPQTFGPGLVVALDKADPFGSAWLLKFFDGTDIHSFTLGQKPSVTVGGGRVTLSIQPPTSPGGYSTLVSAEPIGGAE